MTVLPRSMWMQLWLDRVEAMELPYDVLGIAADLLAWESEHYAWGPRRTAKGRYGTPVADCGDCITTGPEKAYCGLHRCRGTNSNGARCKRPANEVNGLMYCRTHGCQQDLGRQGLWCSEPAGTDGYCTAHHRPLITMPD